MHVTVCVCVCRGIYVCMEVCVFVCLCACVWMPAWENRLNLIYSPRGHLLTESNPLTEPRPNGSLTRLLLYIAAVMGTSLEILVLLICALLHRFEQKCLTFCTRPLSTGKLLMHYSCNGSINLPTPCTPISPPAACQDSDSSEDRAWWGGAIWVRAAHACSSTSITS